MKTIYAALCWAIAILLVAVGNVLGLIDDDTAETLFLVLPIVAVLSLNGGRECRLRRREA